MDLGGEHIKTAGAGVGIIGAIVAANRWLFTNTATVERKIAVLEVELRAMHTKLDTLTEAVTKALDRGADRMQKHEDEINGVKIECARIHGGGK